MKADFASNAFSWFSQSYDPSVMQMVIPVSQELPIFIVQVILSLAFADVNTNTAAIYVLHNAQLQNTSIAGPLENLTTIHVAFNTRLDTLEINMPPNSSLETLILSNNNLTTVSPAWFINTPNLTEVSLANNSICEYMHRCLIYNQNKNISSSHPVILAEYFVAAILMLREMCNITYKILSSFCLWACNSGCNSQSNLQPCLRFLCVLVYGWLCCADTILVTDTLDFCVLNPLVIGGLDISLLLGGNPWKCDCKLAYIKHLQSGRMRVSTMQINHDLFHNICFTAGRKILVIQKLFVSDALR